MTNAEMFKLGYMSINDFAIKLDNEGLKQADYQACDEIKEWLEEEYKEEPLNDWQQDTIARHIDEIVTEAVAFKYNTTEKAMLQEIIRLQKEEIERLKKHD